LIEDKKATWNKFQVAFSFVSELVVADVISLK
jgi:hypothetical protein